MAKTKYQSIIIGKKNGAYLTAEWDGKSFSKEIIILPAKMSDSILKIDSLSSDEKEWLILLRNQLTEEGKLKFQRYQPPFKILTSEEQINLSKRQSAYAKDKSQWRLGSLPSAGRTRSFCRGRIER